MFARALTLIRASFRLLWAEQSLILLAVAPVLSFFGIVILELAIAALAPTAAVALLVPAAAAVVFLAMFWAAAIVAGANEAAEGRTPTVASATRVAAEHAPAIAAWAFWSLTVGVLIRFASSLFGRFALFAAYAGETAWSVATLMVLPAIVVDGATAREARVRARSLLGSSWNDGLAGQLAFDVAGLVLASPALLLVFVAALADDGPMMGAAIIFCFATFIGVALTVSACLSVYRTMLYRHVTDRSVPMLYGTAVLTTAT